MNEYSRIIIEDFCERYKSDPRFKRLARIEKRSYKLDCEYTSDAEACFISDLIEHCTDEKLRDALIDLDEFMCDC